MADVRVGVRRQDRGNIAARALNIAKHGLLHPINPAANSELIAGEQRLCEVQLLGGMDILVRHWPD